MQRLVSKEFTALTQDTSLAPTSPQIAGRLSFTAAAASLVLLAALHVISPEFDASWRMVSEYALGNYGWVLALMFLSIAASSGAVIFAIKSQIRTRGGKIGLVFLIAVGVGSVMAALFDFKHDLHGLATLVGIPGFVIAPILVSLSLVRNSAWSRSRRLLLLIATIAAVSFVLMFSALFLGLSQSGGQLGPNVLVGWPNRLLIVAYSGWLMTVAWQAIKLHGKTL